MILWGLAAVVIGGIAITELFHWRREKRLEQVRRAQLFRESFVEIRRDLMGLIASNEADPKSRSVVDLYLATSLIVRRMGNYRDVAEDFFDWCTGSDHELPSEFAQQLRLEMQTWGPGMRALWDEFFEQFQELCYTYSWRMRWVIRIVRVIGWVRMFALLDNPVVARSPGVSEISRDARVVALSRELQKQVILAA